MYWDNVLRILEKRAKQSATSHVLHTPLVFSKHSASLLVPAETQKLTVSYAFNDYTSLLCLFASKHCNAALCLPLVPLEIALCTLWSISLYFGPHHHQVLTSAKSRNGTRTHIGLLSMKSSTLQSLQHAIRTPGQS